MLGARPDLSAQIACVKRDLALRERVYPKWVAAGRMKPDAADRELAAMRAVLATLEAVAHPQNGRAGHA